MQETLRRNPELDGRCKGMKRHGIHSEHSLVGLIGIYFLVSGIALITARGFSQQTLESSVHEPRVDSGSAMTTTSNDTQPPFAAKSADLRAGIHELDIASVWSGHPVLSSLLTRGDQQYVAYYAADRQMTIAQRTLGKRAWHYTILPTSVGWDSHNYVTMAFDRKGFLHVSGNMHAVPLIYFRSTRPGDASSLVRVPSMTGLNETRVTYPIFSYGPDGALLFEYRSGKSGAGDTYRNRYDEETKTWKPLTDQPLFQGGTARNAYPMNPVLGPDGWYHQVWVWRDSPMADSNHDLSYAHSRDLVHWETAAGAPLKLPLTVNTPGLIVDPTPMHGGLINGSQSVGFDAAGQLIIAYPKYDAEGKTQLYFARWQQGGWKIQQASHWDYRWDFHGGGSIPMEVMMGPFKASGGQLSLMVHHSVYGTGMWQVDPKTMQLIGSPVPLPTEQEASGAYRPPPGSPLIQQFAHDLGGPEAGGATYLLTWNTLGPNRDQPRPEGAPPPTTLRLLVSP
jgi:BNR repeat-containing family member